MNREPPPKCRAPGCNNAASGYLVRRDEGLCRECQNRNAARLVFDGITAMHEAIEAAQESGLSLDQFIEFVRSNWQRTELERVVRERQQKRT